MWWIGGVDLVASSGFDRGPECCRVHSERWSTPIGGCEGRGWSRRVEVGLIPVGNEGSKEAKEWNGPCWQGFERWCSNEACVASDVEFSGFSHFYKYGLSHFAQLLVPYSCLCHAILVFTIAEIIRVLVLRDLRVNGQFFQNACAFERMKAKVKDFSVILFLSIMNRKVCKSGCKNKESEQNTEQGCRWERPVIVTVQKIDL